MCPAYFLSRGLGQGPHLLPVGSLLTNDYGHTRALSVYHSKMYHVNKKISDLVLIAQIFDEIMVYI